MKYVTVIFSLLFIRLARRSPVDLAGRTSSSLDTERQIRRLCVWFVDAYRAGLDRPNIVYNEIICCR